MDAFDTSLSRRPRAVGLKLGVIVLLLLVVVGAWAGAYWWAKSTGRLKHVEQTVSQMDYQWPAWMSKTAKKAVYTTPEPIANGIDPRDARLLQLERELAEQRRQMEALKNQKSTPAAPAKAPPPEPKKRTRAQAVYVTNAAKPPELPGVPLYTLAVWEYLPCVLENVVNSEIPGMFTVKLTRPVLDATRRHVLLPQGQRIGAKAATAALLLGNERIPTFALSVQLPNGAALELGDAPIMDAAGTNGLTGEVNNHVWRIIWTSLAIEGIRAGQQVLTQEIASQGDGVTVTGIGQHSTNIAQQRLGRAQDTRPTIIAHSGELCNVLIPKAMQLPAFASVSH